MKHSLLVKPTLPLALFLLGLFANSTLIGQFAPMPQPGGICSVGYGELTNWFKPEGNACNNCNVVTITPIKGSTPTTGSAAGTVEHVIPEINFNGAIRTNSGGWMDFNRPTTGTIFNGDNFAIVAVVKSSPSVATTSDWRLDPTILGTFDAGAHERLGLKLADGRFGYGDHDNQANYRYQSTAGPNYSDGKPHIVVINRDDQTTTSSSGFVDGGDQINFNSHNNNKNNFSKFVFGQDDTKPVSSALTGSFGDFILYDETLTVAQRERVETYLALKYGITLAHNYHRLQGLTNSPVYVKDGTFNFDIFGICRADSSGLYQRFSASSNELVPTMAMYFGTGYAGTFPSINSTITIPSDGQYNIIGNDAGLTNFTRNFGNGTANKLGRTWKITDTGSMGAVTLWFQDAKYFLTGLGPYFLSLGSDPGLGIGERFLPLVSDGAGGHYVEVDFPNATDSYFTIVVGNSFAGPANVTKGIELWLRSEKGAVPNTTAITAWNDYSGNDHHVNTSASTGAWSGGSNVNYHFEMKAGALDRQWMTSPFIGQTIIAVGKASGGQNLDGYMGFNGDKGLRKVTGAVDNNLGISDGNDWATGAGILRQNGNVNATPSITDYSIVLGERASRWTRQQFFLGGYEPLRSFNTYDFAEVLVYDTVLSAPHKDRLESYLALKYGITLTHPYYASNWDGTLGTTFYTAGGYGNEIAGIGRDDAGVLNQKQGRSISSRSVVSLALKQHAAVDTANTATFEADMKFMVAGHNGATDSCWTTLDINVSAPQAGIHQRIPREWKMMYSGTWATDSVEVRMFDNVVGYNIPPLPPGATTYYMYVDDNGNFSDGGTTPIPMTAVSAGIWRTKFASTSLLPSPFYFTFGTKMDSTLHGHLVRCKGREIKVYGSRLANQCTALTLKNGATQYRASDAAGITNNTFMISTDATGGCIDTLKWQVPTNAIAGTYRLLVDTLPALPGCGLGSFSPIPANNKPILVRQVQVDTGEVALISWPGDSIYCSTGPNVMPIVGVGCSPGLFSYLAGPLLPSSTTLLLPNTTTGQLLIHQGSIGTHTIKFKTTGASSCKDSMQAVIKIRPVTTPTISYTGSPFCGGTALSPAATLSGTAGGTYSSAPGLVFNNTSTGVIDLPASAPGTYTVFYNPHVDSCANVASTTIVVNAPERAYFDYPDSVMCVGAAQELPSIQYRPATGSFTRVAGAGTLNVDPNTGAINLTTSTPGFYYVQYGGIVGSCTYTALDSFRIKAPTDATFTLANDTLCLNDPAFIPVRTNPNGYFTSFNNLIGIQVDSLTVNPAASTPGGPYDLVYIVPDTFCSDTSSLPMFFRGLAAANLTYSDTVLCENEPNIFPVFLSGVAGGSFYSTNGAILTDSLTGELDVAATPVGVGYNVYYIAPDPSCPDTLLAATIDIDSIPTPDFTILVDSVCQNSGFYEIDQHRISNYSFSLFIGPNQVPGAIVGDSINVDILPPGGPYMVQNIQTTTVCADTAYDFITIVEQDSAGIIFAPPIICLNDNDPFPLITGDGGGIFSLGLAPFLVQVDPDSGIMTLDTNMVLGIYWVVYQTQGLCSDIDSAFVDIRNNLSAQYDYRAVEYCQADTLPVSPEPGFASGGVFSTDSIGLVWIDSIAGTFDPHNSQPGTYLVEYNISSAGACEAVWTDKVIIVEKDTLTTLTYVGSPYCPSDPDPIPILTNSVDSLGLFSGAGLYFSDQDRGIISLAATLPDSYVVEFAKRTVCRELFTFPIVIKPAAQADFSYGEAIFCIGPDNPVPDFISSPGGTFFATPDSVNDQMSIDQTTGEIDLFGTSAGGYQVSYTIAPSGQVCGGTSYFDLRILPQPDGISLGSNHPNDTICENTFVLFKASGAELVNYYLNGDSVGSGLEWEGIGLDSGDVVQAYFQTALGCRDSITRTMHVFDIPEATILSAPSILSGTDSVDIQVQLLTNNTWLQWAVDGIGSVRFTADTGRSVEGDSSQILPIGNTVYLTSDIDPAQFTVTVTPRTFLCTGAPETVTIRVNPNDKDVFVPQVMTPDGNGQNDTWLIQLKNGIDPAAYTIKLFNSAGALVHTMTPLNEFFNGDASDAGYLMDGVYWYLLLDAAGEKLEAGGLTIRRK